MKKLFLIAAVAVGMSAQAQQAFEPTNFGSNWSIGIDGGATTTLAPGKDFIDNTRGAFGLHIQKQISPIFALGIESSLAVNTSSWGTDNLAALIGRSVIVPAHSKTAIDYMYAGVYGGVNLFNLFGGYKCDGRVFDIEVVAGAGWGHDFMNKDAFYPYDLDAEDSNYFVTKAGVNFNFNVCKNLTISLKPFVAWNMTGTQYNPLGVDHTSCAYDRRRATFNCNLGVSYNFGPGFVCVPVQDPAEIDALNARINDLRGQIDECAAATAAMLASNGALAAELEACKNKPVTVSAPAPAKQERFIYYKIGSSKIQADQQPVLEAVAESLKQNKNAKVEVVGWASIDGSENFNLKLATARAEAVKKILVNVYGISADRISAKPGKQMNPAEPEGISTVNPTRPLNRVSVCTTVE